jgi:hypothetical protein
MLIVGTVRSIDEFIIEFIFTNAAHHSQSASRAGRCAAVSELTTRTASKSGLQLRSKLRNVAIGTDHSFVGSSHLPHQIGPHSLSALLQIIFALFFRWSTFQMQLGRTPLLKRLRFTSFEPSAN